MNSDTGINELFKNIDSMPEKIEKALFRKGMKEIASKLVNQAKSLVPVKTGDLKDSINFIVSMRKRKGGVVATIGTNSFYARFVELGFMHAGTPTVHVPARPFLTPVLESAFGSAMSDMKDFLSKEVPRAMAKQAKIRT